MKTQISRLTHDPAKRYSGVYQQQGRMITDADWNELVDLLKDRLRHALAEVVGSGTPHDDGIVRPLRLKEETAPPRILAGALYVGGVRGEVLPERGKSEFAFDEQRDFPGATAPPKDAHVYVDLWERVVTSLEGEASALLDPGLHGADTTSRTRTLVQVKWRPKDDPTRAENPEMGTAVFKATLWDVDAAEERADPCAAVESKPPRVGNYLFRLEVHDVQRARDPNDPTKEDPNDVTLTLKWSSENGAEQHPIVSGEEGGPAFGLPPEFTAGRWVYELFNDVTEAHLGHHLAKGFSPVRAVLVEGDVKEALGKEQAIDPQYVRRWDGTCHLRLTRSGPGQPWSASRFGGIDRGSELRTSGPSGYGHVDLGDEGLVVSLEALKITLELGAHAFVAGDHWLATVREDAHYVVTEGGKIVDDRRVEVANGGLPVGILHRYLELGTTGPDGTLEARDPASPAAHALDFRPLTALTATRVAYAPADQQARWDDLQDGGAPPTTVQQAIDALAGKLDASELPWTVPTCTGQDSVRARLPGVKDLAVGDSSKVEIPLNALLCALDAGVIPYDRGSSRRESVRDLLVKKTGDEMTGPLALRDAGLNVGGTADPGAGNLRVGGDCTIEGDLTVRGQTTTVNTATLEVKDSIVRVNTYPPQASPLEVNGGLEVFRGGTAPNAQVIWDELAKAWMVGVEDDLKRIATGEAQDVVTGIATFRKLPVGYDMVTGEIDHLLGPGKVCITLAHELGGGSALRAGDPFTGLGANERQVLYGAELKPSTGKFKIVARRVAGSGDAVVRWWAVKPGAEGAPATATWGVTVTPATATVQASRTVQFTATVDGISNTSVNWSVSEAGGGTISAAGLYTAPSTQGVFHVVARSVIDSTVFGRAEVTVTPPPKGKDGKDVKDVKEFKDKDAKEVADDKRPKDAKDMLDGGKSKEGEKSPKELAEGPITPGDVVNPGDVINPGDVVNPGGGVVNPGGGFVTPGGALDPGTVLDPVAPGGVAGPGTVVRPGTGIAPGAVTGPGTATPRTFVTPEERPDLPIPGPTTEGNDG